MKDLGISMVTLENMSLIVLEWGRESCDATWIRMDQVPYCPGRSQREMRPSHAIALVAREAVIWRHGPRSLSALGGQEGIGAQFKPERRCVDGTNRDQPVRVVSSLVVDDETGPE